MIDWKFSFSIHPTSPVNLLPTHRKKIFNYQLLFYRNATHTLTQTHFLSLFRFLPPKNIDNKKPPEWKHAHKAVSCVDFFLLISSWWSRNFFSFTKGKKRFSRSRRRSAMRKRPVVRGVNRRWSFGIARDPSAATARSDTANWQLSGGSDAIRKKTKKSNLFLSNKCNCILC